MSADRPHGDASRIDVDPGRDPWERDFAGIDLHPLHQRNYAVRSFRISPEQILIRGVMDDRKNCADMVPWDDRPLVMHHMVVDLVVDYPSLVIAEATAVFDVHPQDLCPAIAPKYERLAGVSITRGFTHTVRETFGGPRGCAHVTALLQAMAPVAVQSTWGMASADRKAAFAATGFDVDHEVLPGPTIEERVAGSRTNLNTCHVFAEDGDFARGWTEGIASPVPLTIRRLLREHGLPDDDGV